MLNNRWSQYLLALGTVLALTVTLWTSYSLNEKAQCLLIMSTQQQEIVRARAVIADGDREVTRTLWHAIAAAKPLVNLDGRTQLQAAIAEYLTAQGSLDILRDKLPYPNPKKCD